MNKKEDVERDQIWSRSRTLGAREKVIYFIWSYTWGLFKKPVASIVFVRWSTFMRVF